MSGATANPQRLTPVAASERLELIDILRGFALLGILVVNFWGAPGDALNRLDEIVSTGIEIAAASSFYPLFSFLFGLGFAMQLLRARERGAEVVNLYLRRMLALFLVGSFHAVVIWSGDILVLYAVMGLLLLPMHRLRDRWLWAIVAIPMVLGLWSPQVRAFTGRLGSADAEATMLARSEAGQRTSVSSNITQRYAADAAATPVEAFASAVVGRWREYEDRLRRIFTRDFFLSKHLAFFVIGLIIGRRRILQEPGRHRRPLAIAAAAGLLAWAAGTTIEYLWEPESRLLGELAGYGGNYGATVFYIAGIALTVTSWPRLAAFLRQFAAAGRLALTNYVMQSVVMTLLFVRYGMGLERPSTTVWLLINLAFFFAVQIPFSRWWIARYRFGPAEWVWRTMTYGERQPMRIHAPAPPTVPAPPVLAS